MSQCSVGVAKAYGNYPGKKGDLFQFSRVDFAKIAQEFGCLGIRVDDPKKIKFALQTALEADKPVLIDVVTDEKCKPDFEPSY